MNTPIITEGTVLSKVVSDMWPIIQTYYDKYYDNHYVFAIGKFDGIYEGRRLINKWDIDDIRTMKMLQKYYQKWEGLLMIDDCDTGYLCGEGLDLYSDIHHLRCIGANKWYIARFTKNDIAMDSINTIQSCAHNGKAIKMLGYEKKILGVFIIDWIL